MEEIIAKLNNLEDTRRYLQSLGIYNPKEVETDMMIEDAIEYFTDMLNLFY